MQKKNLQKWLFRIISFHLQSVKKDRMQDLQHVWQDSRSISRDETQARESGDFLDYENDYEEDEYYDEDGGSYEEYEDGSAPAEESYETDGAEENNAEADGEDRE